MKSQQRVRLVDIARKAGVSVATVSYALRNDPCISSSRREQIRRLATDMGYEPDPMLSALIAYRNQQRIQRYHGVIAFLGADPDLEQWSQRENFAELFRGASEAALRAGFEVRYFQATGSRRHDQRLATELENAGIRGLLIATYPLTAEEIHFDWNRFAAISLLRVPRHLAIHSVGQDHFLTATRAIQEIGQRGYRRLGLVAREDVSRRITHQWYAALNTAPTLAPGIGHTAVFWHPDARPPVRELTDWVRRERLDAVISHGNGRTLHALAKGGLVVPDELGYADLHLFDQPSHVSGVYQSLPDMGEIAVKWLLSSLHNNDLGEHEFPCSNQLRGHWNPGTTLRPLPEPEASTGGAARTPAPRKARTAPAGKAARAGKPNRAAAPA